jgi:hypothetical protein
MNPMVIPALVDINLPRNLRIEPVADFESLMKEVGRKSMAGYSGSVFFGTAFIQGGRLQFTTAMPMAKMIEVSLSDRSHKRDTVGEVTMHANRPVEPSHAKKLRSYLLETACAGDQFILPSFTFNYGVDMDEDTPQATLVIFGSPDQSTNAWPAMFLLPAGTTLDTTDGAHRRGEIEEILEGNKATPAQKGTLRKNAVDVKIVFEANRGNSHQDFADCGRAKAIAKSLITTYDIREPRNSRTRALVQQVPFLHDFVDATASNVNLSAKSRMIWSMSAVRLFVAHCDDKHANVALHTVVEKTEDADKFFEEVVKHLPQLQALNAARTERPPQVTTATLRERRGGDVLLRGTGMAILARAFLYCIENHITFSHMAKTLARIDWSMLKVERSALPDPAKEENRGDVYRNAVLSNANPLWASALVIAEDRYKIASSSASADAAWAQIVDGFLTTDRIAAE